MSTRDVVKGAALGFAIDAVFALHPGVWTWSRKAERKSRERPLWKRVARAVLGGVLVMFVDRFVKEMREELEAREGCT